MKRIYAIICCLLIACSMFAETKPRFGIIGGLTTSSATIKSLLPDLKSKNFNQFHVGICYNQPLILGFAIQPGLEYNVKGVKEDGVSIKTGYLELPVQIQWGLDLLAVLRPYIFAEPFIGYSVYHKYDVKDVASGTEVGNFGNKFEGGLGLGAGIDIFKHVQVSFRYFWNFGKLNQINFLNTSIRTENCQGFKVSAAILF